MFDSNGNLLRSFGHRGENPGEFYYPNGIAIDKDRNNGVTIGYRSLVGRGGTSVLLAAWEASIVSSSVLGVYP